MNLYVYADPSSPAASLYADIDASKAIQFPELVVGDTIPVNIYLIDGAGSTDSRSGSAAYSVTVSIGDPTETISGGTFTVTHSANTTSNLAWNITATGLQTALNALASVASAGGLAVTGSAGLFLLTWNTTGTKADFASSGALLEPYGAVEISTTNDGSSGNKTQILQLMTASLCTHPAFFPESGYWSGQINLNTLPTHAALAGEAFKNKVIQISIIGSGGAQSSFLQMPVTVRNRISSSESSPYVPPSVGFSETDPLFSASEAANFVTGDKAKLDSAYSWGNHAVAGYATRSWVTTNYYPLAGGKINGAVGIGANPVPCALLNMDSTTKGVLFPRMTKAQRDAISSPIAGLIIWQTNETQGFRYYTGSAWVPLESATVSTLVCEENGKTYGVKMMISGGDDNKPYIEPYLIS